MVAVLKLLALCTARQDSFKKNKEVGVATSFCAVRAPASVQVYSGP